MYEKLDIVSKYQNKTKTSFPFFLLEIFFEEKRWVHANPTLYDKGSKCEGRYKNYYVHEKMSNSVDKFYGYLTNRLSKFVILEGKRGSGKTSFLNYFFNHKTRELNEKAGLTWVRIDTTKIYKNELSFRKSLDFETYFYGQLLFVYFRYNGENNHSQASVENTSCKTEIKLHDNKSFRVPSCDRVFASITREMLIGENNDLEEQYNSAREISLNAKNFDDGLDKPFFGYEALGKRLFDLVADNLILVIDGIDNIGYTSLVKHAVWKNLEKFLDKIAQTPIHKVVLTLRDENHQILANKLPYLNADETAKQKIPAPDILTLPPTSLTDIIQKLEHGLINTKNMEQYDLSAYHDFLKKILNLYHEIFTENEKIFLVDGSPHETMELRQFKRLDIQKLSSEEVNNWLHKEVFISNPKFISKLKKKGYALVDEIQQALAYKLQSEKDKKVSLKEAIEHHELTNYFIYAKAFEKLIAKAFHSNGVLVNSTLEEVFNNDTRELFILSYKSYAQFINLSKKDEDINTFSNFEKYIENKYFWIMEPLFKNGNEYHGSKNDIMFHPPYRNINFINIFNLLDYKAQEIEPLYFIYILHELRDKKKSKEEIAKTFELDEGFVGKSIDELLEFGYISVTFGGYNQKGYYMITPKGNNILTYSLVDITVLQNYIYGALVQSGHEEYYQVYTENNYASVILFNVALFWYELSQQEKKLRKPGMNIEIIPDKAKEIFHELLEKSFPIHYMYSDIKKNISNKELAKKLSNFVEYNILGFKFKDKDIIKQKDKLNRLSKMLDGDERCVFLLHYFDKKPDDIVNDYRLHKFIFGDFNEDLMQERKQELRRVSNSVSFSMLRSLEKKLERL